MSLNNAKILSGIKVIYLHNISWLFRIILNISHIFSQVQVYWIFIGHEALPIDQLDDPLQSAQLSL